MRQSAGAAKALSTFVRMQLAKHGSGKAIEHWRGSRSTPLDQIPRVANLSSVQKGEGKRCQMVVVRIAAPGRKTDRGLAGSSAPRSRHRPGKRTTLGVRSSGGRHHPRSCGLRSYHAGAHPNDEVAPGPWRRVGGHGKYGSLLDCPARGVRSNRLGSPGGRYAPVGARAGAR